MPINLLADKVLFRDLSEERRWEVIHDGLQFSDFWWEQVQEDVESELKKEGILTPDFQWSGFHSQGDGGSFTAEVDLNEFFKYHLDKFDFDEVVDSYRSNLNILKDYWKDRLIPICNRICGSNKRNKVKVYNAS